MNLLDMQRVAACHKAIARLDTEIAAARLDGTASTLIACSTSGGHGNVSATRS